jgi:hypothetical protein
VPVLVKIGVVGSGPCGLLFANILLKNGFSVTMLDIGSSEESSIDITDSLKTLKLNGTSNSTYDINQFEKIETNSTRKWFTSKSLLGFSQVWGGTWQENTKEFDSNWNMAYKEIDEILNFNAAHLSIVRVLSQCDCLTMNFISKDQLNSNAIKYYRTKLLFKDFSEYPKFSEDFDINQNIIWDADVLFRSCLSYKNFTYQNNYYVRDIVSNNSKLVLNGFDSKSFDFDFVALAGGPVSNSTILIRSNIADQIILKDTRLVYVPFLNLRPTPRHKHGFSHSLFSIDILTDSEIGYHLQFYSHLEKVLERILVIIPSKFRTFFKFIFIYFSRHFGVILVYADKDLSQSIRFSMDDNVIKARNIKPKLKNPKLRLFKDLTFKLLNFGLIPLWFFAKFTTPGESYHLGSASGVEMNLNGSIKQFPNVYILGTFPFKDLYPGPVTKSAMAQTYLAAIDLVKKLNLGDER